MIEEPDEEDPEIDPEAEGYEEQEE